MLYKAFIHGLRYPEQGVLKGSEKRVYYRLLGSWWICAAGRGSIRQELTTAEVVEELVTLHRGMLFEWRIYEGGFPLAQRGRRMAEHLLEGCGDEGPDHPQASAIGRRSAV